MNKQRILTIPFATLCLLSCSSSGQGDTDIPEPNTPDTNLESIAFGGNNDAWQDAPTTRTDVKNGLENLFTSFRVWCHKTTDAALSASQTVMDGYNVVYTANTNNSTTTNTDGWEYVGIQNANLTATQSIKYWDHAATSYRFFAYTPADATVTTSFDDISTKASFSFPYTYSENATATTMPYISQLWYSTKESQNKKYGQCVTLTFAPQIAKVRFRFTYPANTTKITIKDIQFRDSRFIDDPTTATTPLGGIITATYPITGKPTANGYGTSDDTNADNTDADATTATYLPQFSWTATAKSPTGALVFTIPYESESDHIHILTDKTKYEKWYYVPPLDIIPYEQGPYTITAHIDGNYSSATVPAAFMHWKAGYQYTYIFKITEAGTVITFADLQVEQWLPGSNIDNQGTGTEGF